MIPVKRDVYIHDLIAGSTHLCRVKNIWPASDWKKLCLHCEMCLTVAGWTY